MFNEPIQLNIYLGEMVENLQVFELFTFLLCSIDLSGLCIIISKYKEVSFVYKSNGCDRPNKIGANIPVRLCCSRLEAAIILFLGFCPFVAIANKSLCIVDEFSIRVYEIFLLHSEVKVTEFLIS